jgi:hypothetical protein
MKPFLVRFGRTIANTVSAEPIRYDNSRQEGLIFESGVWIAALDAVDPGRPRTLITEVKRETTDNE